MSNTKITEKWPDTALCLPFRILRSSMRSLHGFAVGIALSWFLVSGHAFAADSEGVPKVTNQAEQKRILKESCSMNKVQNLSSTPISDIFIDYRFLPMAIGSKYEPNRNRWPYVTEYDVIQFLLGSGFSAIETQKDFFPSSQQELRRGAPILRFELMDADAPACRNWPDQYTSPMVRLPSLRMLGVRPDQCIGIRELPSPTAEGRIEVKRTRLYFDPAVPSEYHWRLDITASAKRRNEAGNPASHSVMHVDFFTVGQHGDANFVLGCAAGKASSSGNAVTAVMDSLPPNGKNNVTPPPIIARSSGAVPIVPAIPEQISSIRWLKTQATETGNMSFYYIDSKGVVWTARSPARSNWAVYVSQKNRLLFSEIPNEQPQLFYLTRALGVTSLNGYAAVLELSTKPAEIRLFEFDNDLNLIKILKLTPAQLAEILNKAKVAG